MALDSWDEGSACRKAASTQVNINTDCLKCYSYSRSQCLSALDRAATVIGMQKLAVDVVFIFVPFKDKRKAVPVLN
jgi:hypothetical protein